MSKAALISIRPKWAEKIANGEKTIEVRKTRPKLQTPFKCYIYCTKDKHLAFMQNATGTNLIACMDAEAAIPVGGFVGNGKVIGEFICNHITNLFANSRFWLSEDDVLHTCFSSDEIRKYANGANGLYGWHISDLLIYDKPRELSEFTGLRTFKGGFELREIDRPPQSWTYVQEV